MGSGADTGAGAGAGVGSILGLGSVLGLGWGLGLGSGSGKSDPFMMVPKFLISPAALRIGGGSLEVSCMEECT